MTLNTPSRMAKQAPCMTQGAQNPQSPQKVLKVIGSSNLIAA